jgi:hypothetical protein
LESELIVDRQGGAATVKFSDMSTKELLPRAKVFPEALLEYSKRLQKDRLGATK